MRDLCLRSLPPEFLTTQFLGIVFIIEECEPLYRPVIPLPFFEGNMWESSQSLMHVSEQHHAEQANLSTPSLTTGNLRNTFSQLEQISVNVDRRSFSPHQVR
jgi:hypothetical protein